MHRTRNKNRGVHIAGAAHKGCTQCNCPILIVEDQKSIANLLQAIISERYGFASVIAASLSEAEKIIETQPIHLAISDLNLPDAPYGEIIDTLSRHRISTIALTGAFGQEMRETILRKGAIDYIPKQGTHAIEYAAEMANRIYRNHHTHVLVVDDSLSTKALLKHILETLKFNVITASNAEEALAIIAERSDLRLALVDYEMPGMNGCELIHEIRKQISKEDLAIIGISGSGADDISAQFLKSGANDFVRKPYSYEEILCRVGQNLEMLDLIQSNRDAAYRDFLTGLHNRRHFFEEGSRLHSHAVKKGNTVVAMLDVDHFKKVNDTYGHDCGDLVLKELAALLSEHFDKHLVARLGGEEFAVVMTGTSIEQARNIFEDFCLEVASQAAHCNGETIPYTISIGLTDQLGETIDDFIKSADQLLYKAKDEGRNRVAVREK